MPVCTQCNRETKAAVDTCLYCGGVMIGEKKAQVSCPRCATAMRRDTVEGIELDFCDGCGGTWYDRGELEQHIATGEPDPGAAPEQPADREFHREADTMDTRYLKCPFCANPMTRKNWGRLSGIIVDVCGPHGMFLDAGELEKIRDFEASGTKVRAERLETWERQHDESERRRDVAELNRKLKSQSARSRTGFWLGWS